MPWALHEGGTTETDFEHQSICINETMEGAVLQFVQFNACHGCFSRRYSTLLLLLLQPDLSCLSAMES